MDFQPLDGTLILLSSGVAAMGFSGSLRLSPVIGFFIAGAIIGPFGFGLVNPQSGVLPVLSELGICFLLFDAGLHISVTHLKARWKGFVGVGSLQIAIVGGMIAFAASLFGYAPFASVVIGIALALSSTAIVLKMLHDEQEEDSPVGHSAVELLVFQDLVGILLLVVLGSLGSGIGDAQASISATILRTFGHVGLSVLFVAVGSRILLRPFFKIVTRIGTDEAFTAAALLFVLFTCWLTHFMGLSLALGAFLAGVTLSESNYSYLVRTEVAPFRSLLLSLFFLSIGMSIDVHLIASRPGAVVLGVLALMSIKVIGMLATMWLTGVRCEVGTRLGFLLSQGSEFAFVILLLCVTAKVLTPADAAFMAAIVGVSMLATPLIGAGGCKLSRCVAKMRAVDDETVAAPEKGEIVIVEFDEIAREIASAFNDSNILYRGHDRDWDRISYARSRGFNVHFSDPDRPRTLSRASVGEVVGLIVLVEDDAILDLLLSGMKKVAPHVPILGATREPGRLEIYARHGVESAFYKNSKSAGILFETMLQQLGYPADAIAEMKARSFAKQDGESFFPRTLGFPAFEHLEALQHGNGEERAAA